MGTKLYGYNRVAFTVTMADNASITATGGLQEYNGVYGVTDPADGIFDVTNFVWGGILVPTGWVAADVTFKAATTRAGTYSFVQSNTATATIARCLVGASTVPAWFPIPDEVFRCGPFIKVNATNTASAADVSQTGGPLAFAVYLGC
jgi:hypothetical protein